MKIIENNYLGLNINLPKITDKKISVIIPAFNEEEYIENCLNSLLKQKENIYEIIVVDNASTDKTSGIVKKFKDIKLIQESKKGVTHARRKGADNASGNILVFVDADNILPLDWSKKILNEFRADQKLACVSGPYVYDTNFIKDIVVSSYWYFVAAPSYFVTGYMAIAGNFAIRKDVYEKIGGFNPEIEFYGDDTDISRRASAYGKSKFKNSLKVYSSSRRLDCQGILKTGLIYASNFLSIAVIKKPVTKKYKDYR